jgi:hypothetical protein
MAPTLIASIVLAVIQLVLGCFLHSAALIVLGGSFLAIIGRKWWGHWLVGAITMPVAIYSLAKESGTLNNSYPLLGAIVFLATLFLLELFTRKQSGVWTLSLVDADTGVRRIIGITLLGAGLTLLRPDLWWSDAITGFTLAVILIRQGSAIRRQEQAKRDQLLGLIQECGSSTGGGCQGCSSGKGKLFE